MLELSTADWTAIIAGPALILSLFNLWYTILRKGRPIFACSRWAAIGLTAKGQPGASFAVQIGIVNNGSRPLLLKDFMLAAETPHRKIFYDPILLFDLTQYIADVGRNDRITRAQKGQAPLPILIPACQQYDFPCEVLFMPYDKKTTVLIESDTPCILNLYALTDRSKSYELIATQELSREAVQELKSGGFSGVLSTASTKIRESFIRKFR